MKAVFPGGVAWRLAEFLDGISAQGGGRLTLIALDPAREHFGSEWPRVGPKVHAIVEGTLRKFLGAEDVFRAIDDLSYIIMFRDDRSAAAASLIEDVGAEISRRIMGENNARILVRFVHMSLVSNGGGAGGETQSDCLGGTAADGRMTGILKAGNMERILARIAGDEERFSLESLGHVLLPICSTDTFQVVSLRCLPALNGGGTLQSLGYHILPLDPDIALVAELDALTAEFAGTELDSGNACATVTIPIHRITLSSRKFRDIYLRICRGLLHRHKERVIFDITGIEEGTPANRVTEYVQWLRPYARAVIATVGVDFSTLASFSGSGIWSVGAEVLSGDQTGIEQRLAKFASRVKAINTKCHVHNVASRKLSNLCLVLPIDHIDGNISDGELE